MTSQERRLVNSEILFNELRIMQTASLITVVMTLAIIKLGSAAESTAVRAPRGRGIHLEFDGPLNDSVIRTLDKIDNSVDDLLRFAHLRLFPTSFLN